MVWPRHRIRKIHKPLVLDKYHRILTSERERTQRLLVECMSFAAKILKTSKSLNQTCLRTIQTTHHVDMMPSSLSMSFGTTQPSAHSSGVLPLDQCLLHIATTVPARSIMQPTGSPSCLSFLFSTFGFPSRSKNSQASTALERVCRLQQGMRIIRKLTRHTLSAFKKKPTHQSRMDNLSFKTTWVMQSTHSQILTSNFSKNAMEPIP